jgi:GGDEF domain-containing protein
MKKTVIVASRDIVLTNLATGLLGSLYNVIVFGNIPSVLDYIYNSIPSLVVIDIGNVGMEDKSVLTVINDLKDDPLFRQIPVFAILPDRWTVDSWDTFFVDDYTKKSALENELKERVTLAIMRSERVVEINPLTRLPGNISINRQIQERLDRKDTFAFGYADLDYFKPFNDRYGFGRGDEVIRITGRLILNIVKSKQPQDSFIGHIGGDDFVFIVLPDLAEEISQDIIDAFDQIVPAFYDPADRENGGIQSFDRRGNADAFPIMNISIGINDTLSGKFSHYGEITEAAAEMKKYAKQFKGSCYRYNKRQSADEEVHYGG